MASVLADPNTQQNGRSGQEQHGVDVYGFRSAGRLVGVQCKKKYEAEVTKKELRAEVEKAKGFKPELAEFILATTAPRDQKIQTVARQITEELAKTAHPMTVAVWGWEDIEDHASRHGEAHKAFDPTWNPFVEKGFGRMDLRFDQLMERLDTIQSGGLPAATVAADADTENTVLHGKITAFLDMINDGQVTAAIPQLEKIRASNWATASRSERYRLLVAFAAAKFKQGDYVAAGAQLIDAYSECPEHKKAKQNRAKGYLLADDATRAIEAALDALKADAANADAASTLIQARIHDPAVTDPLAGIPPELHGTEDVLIGRIHFMRCRDDVAWLALARQSFKDHPDSRHLKVFAAEAILDELTRSERGVLAGAPAKNVSQEDLQSSVKALQDEALDAIDKGYKIQPSLANNAAVALRFVDNVPAAVQILDGALAQHPDDENLRFQRAVLAFGQNDSRKTLELLPDNTANPESVPIRATALADTGKLDEALALLDGFDASGAPEHVKSGLLSTRCHIYLVRDEKQLAAETAQKAALTSPDDPHVAAVLIRTLYLAGDAGGASVVLDKTVARFDEATPMSSRMLLSFEAERLNRNDVVVSLLKGYVATNHDSEALRLLIAAAINGQFWVTARETLDSLAEPVAQQEHARRARTILALNSGSPDADQLVGAYLKDWPNDASMMLTRIGAWQRTGRNADIEAFVKTIDFDALKGSPDTRMRVAGLAVRYGDAARGLDFAYGLLMDNWNTPKAHLIYHGLMLNDHIAPVMPASDVVADSTVVYLTGDDGEHAYRLEKRSHRFFEDERLAPKSDLARLLLGKRVGEAFTIRDGVGAKPVRVREIKPIYLDAFHRSLSQFNERFPHNNGMLRFTFDANAEDPLGEIRAITKDRADANLSFLEEYRSKGLPLAFIATMMGCDPLEAWAGLPSAGMRLQVCRGMPQDREEALRLLTKRERKGCVLDALTLSVIRRLKVGDAVAAVCGPLHAPQSVLDLFATRALEAQNNVGKEMGFIAWRDEQLVMHDYTDEMLNGAAAENEAERAWSVANVAVAAAMPKEDFSRETRLMIETVGHLASDAAVAADGGDLLLLSDDMGFRVWSELSFTITSTWLQPVLMVARHEGHLAEERYFEAINTLALGGHSYTSLEPGSLLLQARRDGFTLTDNLRKLLDLVGGPTADVVSNCSVLTTFLSSVADELKAVSDDLTLMKIASQAFESMAKGRDDQRTVVALIAEGVTSRKSWLKRHALAWLVGHSIGRAEFDELLALERKYRLN